MRHVHDLPLVEALVRALDGTGVDLSRAYLVGGAVRDALLGRRVIDLDIAVEGPGSEFAEELASALGGKVVARHRFGTAAVVADLGSAFPDARIDIATVRTETYDHPGALPTVTPADSIDDDLARRDFTVNAIAAPLDPARAGELVDPLGGVADLHARLVRVLHAGSFPDDPTRIFRAARYAGRYGFAIEAATRRLALDAVAGGALATVSVERVRAEVELVLEEPAAASLALLHELGVLGWMHPGLASEAARDEALALVARIDVAAGDDDTRQLMAWRMRFAALCRPLGAAATKALARELRLRARDIDAVARHAEALELVATRGSELADATMPELRALLARLGPESLEVAALAADDAAVTDALARYRSTVGETRLTLSGHDLLALGLDRGPEVGEALEELYDRKLAGELPSSRDELVAAEQIVARYAAARERRHLQPEEQQ